VIVSAKLYTQFNSGTSRATEGPEETFSRGPSGKKIFEFLFKMEHLSVGLSYISESRQGPQTSRYQG